MNHEVLFSHKSDLWSTPQKLFDELNEEFHFTLDPCADESNHKCDKYFTEKDDGLKQDWTGETVFCNPPYSCCAEWVQKASESKCTTVMLLPVRSCTRWFHQFIYQKEEIRFIKGRLRFGDAKNSAPFPSMIVVFRR